MHEGDGLLVPHPSWPSRLLLSSYSHQLAAELAGPLVEFGEHQVGPVELNLQVRTPRLVLVGATDDLLEWLIPVVRAGVAGPAAPVSAT
jgi:hypothetical protein